MKENKTFAFTYESAKTIYFHDISQLFFISGYQLTCTLDSSSLTREIISTKAWVVSVFGFEAQRSLIILIARLRTLTPVSFIRSATFSIYCDWKMHSKPYRCPQICHKVTWYVICLLTFRPTSGCEAICLPTSSRAASRTEIAESQNLPSTADWTRLSPKTSGSASTILLTYREVKSSILMNDV